MAPRLRTGSGTPRREHWGEGGRVLEASREHARLLHRVRRRFDEPEQRRHYEAEAPRGLTPAEGWLLDAVRAGHVLDVGCGAGRVALALRQRGLAVTGVEVSRALLRTAAALTPAAQPAVRFALVDPLRLPFTQGCFDAAIAFKVCGYLPGRATRRAWLDELWRVLRPGGRVYLTQHVVPEEALGFAEDEHYRQAAREFAALERGDTFPAGRGYVHWFTARALHDGLRQESDKGWWERWCSGSVTALSVR